VAEAESEAGRQQQLETHADVGTGMRPARLRAALAAAVALLLALGGFVAGVRPSFALETGAGAGFTAESSGTADASGTPDASATPAQPATHTASVIGTSLRGRPIELETFGSGSRRILVLAGVHGNEYGTPVAEAFLRYVRLDPSVVPSGTQLDVVACANPDGYAARRRANARNVDINRNFPSRNWSRKRNRSGASPGVRPGSEPETRALLALLESRRYVRVVSLHSRGGILDWDGPGGWTLAKRMSTSSRVGVHRLGAYHGSMGAFVPAKYRIPIITWELSSRTMSWRVREGLMTALR
jgi:murein peptide amidase A